MSKLRPMLEPPAEGAHRIMLTVWNASGPGRAWNLREQARGIKRGSRDWKLAQHVIACVDEIFRCYHKGASDYATLLLERLDAQVTGVLVERNKQSNVRRRGGSKTARDRKRAAAERDTKLLLAALAIRAVNPRMSNADLALKLHERGHGGKEAIRKKLRKLLP